MLTSEMPRMTSYVDTGKMKDINKTGIPLKNKDIYIYIYIYIYIRTLSKVKTNTEGDADKILGWPFRPCPIIAWNVSQLLNETVVDEVNACIYEFLHDSYVTPVTARDTSLQMNRFLPLAQPRERTVSPILLCTVRRRSEILYRLRYGEELHTFLTLALCLRGQVHPPAVDVNTSSIPSARPVCYFPTMTRRIATKQICHH